MIGNFRLARKILSPVNRALGLVEAHSRTQRNDTHTHQHALTYTKATNLLEKTKNREKQEDRRKWAIYDQMRGKILHHCRTSHNRLIHPRNKKLRLSF